MYNIAKDAYVNSQLYTAKDNTPVTKSTGLLGRMNRTPKPTKEKNERMRVAGYVQKIRSLGNGKDT